MKYTKHTLKKLELLLEEQGYIIRYEKGNFQSGYAIVKDQKVIIVNKFFETDARIGGLLEIISQVEISEEILSDKSKKTYQQLLKLKSEDAEENNA